MNTEELSSVVVELKDCIEFLSSPRIRELHWEWKKASEKGIPKLILTSIDTEDQRRKIVIEQPKFEDGDILFGGFDFVRQKFMP